MYLVVHGGTRGIESLPAVCCELSSVLPGKRMTEQNDIDVDNINGIHITIMKKKFFDNDTMI